MWKIVEGLVLNLSDPITCSFSDRRGRTCVVYHAGDGRLGTLKKFFSSPNSFRWRSIRILNRLPRAIRMLSSCSVVGFKSQYGYFKEITDARSFLQQVTVSNSFLKEMAHFTNDTKGQGSTGTLRELDAYSQFVLKQPAVDHSRTLTEGKTTSPLKEMTIQNRGHLNRLVDHSELEGQGQLHTHTSVSVTSTGSNITPPVFTAKSPLKELIRPPLTFSNT